MDGVWKLIVGLATLFWVTHCETDSDDLIHRMMTAENTDEFNMAAFRAGDLGHDGIPIILTVLGEIVGTNRQVFTLAKIDTCTRVLRDLAREGVHTVNEVPLLVEVMRNRMLVMGRDEDWAVETLIIITGVDPDWDELIARDWTSKEYDELGALFNQEVDVWERWYEEHRDPSSDAAQ